MQIYTALELREETRTGINFRAVGVRVCAGMAVDGIAEVREESKRCQGRALMSPDI